MPTVRETAEELKGILTLFRERCNRIKDFYGVSVLRDVLDLVEELEEKTFENELEELLNKYWERR